MSDNNNINHSEERWDTSVRLFEDQRAALDNLVKLSHNRMTRTDLIIAAVDEFIAQQDSRADGMDAHISHVRTFLAKRNLPETIAEKISVEVAQRLEDPISQLTAITSRLVQQKMEHSDG
jgi:hypothetical protein